MHQLKSNSWFSAFPHKTFPDLDGEHKTATDAPCGPYSQDSDDSKLIESFCDATVAENIDNLLVFYDF